MVYEMQNFCGATITDTFSTIKSNARWCYYVAYLGVNEGRRQKTKKTMTMIIAMIADMTIEFKNKPIILVYK